MNRNLFLISSSVVYGSGYLDKFAEPLSDFLKNVSEILFVPYAAAEKDWDAYTCKVRDRFQQLGINIIGIHDKRINHENIYDHKAVFIGGGNSFRLLYQLQSKGLLSKLNDAVLNKGMRYIGSSAGSNVACKTICTTNDMPIIFPKEGFDAINLIPLQINPHYIDPVENSTHMGETRDTRINEFHEANDTPVIGLREGAYLLINDEYYNNGQLFLGGINGAKFFFKNKEPINIPGSCNIILRDNDLQMMN